MLFGAPGLRVTDADPGPGGTLEVWAVSEGSPGPACCPDCGTPSARVHDRTLTRPRDVRRAGDPVDLNVVKRRLKCENAGCRRKTFTERTEAVPPRCRLTSRLREQCAAEVIDRGMTETEAARHAGVSWPVAHAAYAGSADEMLAAPAAPVTRLGIDEHRRGRPRWRRNEQTGEYELLADRWHVNFTDLDQQQGMLAQVEGRTADDTAYWLLSQPAAWRDRIEIVSIDLCTIFKSAIRRALPRAQIAADLFHVVQLGVKMVGDVRRRVVRTRYGRRGRSGDPEYGVKMLLVRNIEKLRPDKIDKILDKLEGTRTGQEILVAWKAKELLRKVLNLRFRCTGSQPGERAIHDRLFTFYDWCATYDYIPELLTLARTVSRWETEIICAILTGASNAASESMNRIAKLEARLAYGFRNPVNQRRRVRIACTRGVRRRQSRTATTRRKRNVTSRPPDPG